MSGRGCRDAEHRPRMCPTRKQASRGHLATEPGLGLGQGYGPQPDGHSPAATAHLPLPSSHRSLLLPGTLTGRPLLTARFQQPSRVHLQRPSMQRPMPKRHSGRRSRHCAFLTQDSFPAVASRLRALDTVPRGLLLGDNCTTRPVRLHQDVWGRELGAGEAFWKGERLLPMAKGRGCIKLDRLSSYPRSQKPEGILSPSGILKRFRVLRTIKHPALGWEDVFEIPIWVRLTA